MSYGFISILEIAHSNVENIANKTPDFLDPYQLANNIGNAKKGSEEIKLPVAISARAITKVNNSDNHQISE